MKKSLNNLTFKFAALIFSTLVVISNSQIAEAIPLCAPGSSGLGTILVSYVLGQPYIPGPFSVNLENSQGLGNKQLAIFADFPAGQTSGWGVELPGNLGFQCRSRPVGSYGTGTCAADPSTPLDPVINDPISQSCACVTRLAVVVLRSQLVSSANPTLAMVLYDDQEQIPGGAITDTNLSSTSLYPNLNYSRNILDENSRYATTAVNFQMRPTNSSGRADIDVVVPFVMNGNPASKHSWWYHAFAPQASCVGSNTSIDVYYY